MNLLEPVEGENTESAKPSICRDERTIRLSVGLEEIEILVIESAADVNELIIPFFCKEEGEGLAL